MIIIIWSVMKNYRNLIGHIKFQITCAMCCASVFTGMVAMVSNFMVVFIFSKLFYEFFFYRCNILVYFDVILVFFLLTLTNFFQNQLCFLHDLLKIHKTFSCNFFRDTNYVYFLYDQMPKLLTLNIRKEYIFLFLLLKIFLDYFYSYQFFLLIIQCQHEVNTVFNLISCIDFILIY